MASDERVCVGLKKGNSVAHTLIDSGASRSLISRNKWEEWCELDCRPAILQPGFSLRSVSGHLIKTCGIGTLKVLGRELRLHVVDNMGHDLLLGIDALKALQCQICCLKQQVRLAGISFDWGKCNLDIKGVAGVQGTLEYWQSRYPGVFAGEAGVLPPTTNVKLSVDVQGHPPIRQRGYRVPLQVQEQVKAEIDKMLAQGIIQRSSSPWASPMLIVPKSDGGLRVCIDYRAVNNVSRKDASPIPNIQEIFDQLKGSTVFSVLDLKSAFWQVECEEKSREILAFTTPWGLFEPLRMQFGFCNSPPVWQRHISTIFAPHLGVYVVIYLDDIVVHSLNEEDHAKHLEEVFRLIAEYRLTLNAKKCRFFQTEVPLLGYVVGGGGIRPDPEKVRAIRQMAPPTDVKGVQRLLGMVNYYRQCIPHFADIAAPLVALTHKKVKFAWGPAQDSALAGLKEALSSEKVMSFPDNQRPYRLYCDASSEAIGGVLTQQDDQGIERPIHYFSKQLSEGQKRWATVEREAYAIIFALQKLRPYLYGATFSIVTDHRPIKNLFQTEIKNSKIQRWAVLLAEYGAPIEYCKGSTNVKADMLSRIKPLQSSSPETSSEGYWGFEEIAGVVVVEPDSTIMQLTKHLVAHSWYPGCLEIGLVGKDAWDNPYVDKAGLVELQRQMPQYGEGDEGVNDFLIQDGVLYTLSPPRGQPSFPRIVLPPELVEVVVYGVHEHIGHQGSEKTWHEVARLFKWGGMNKDVLRVVQGCELCSKYRMVKHYPESQPAPIPGAPGVAIGIDLIGPLPLSHRSNTYAIMAMDFHSGWAEARPIPSKHAKHIVDFLENEWVSRYGPPSVIQSDRGLEFSCAETQTWAKKAGVKWKFSSPYHPCTNGKIERFNGTLKKIIAKLVEGRVHDWERQLGRALWAYRSTISTVTGFSPFFLQYGRDPPTRGRRADQIPPDFEFQALLHRVNQAVSARARAAESSARVQSQNKQRLDRRPSPPTFGKNQPVLIQKINPTTFMAKYEGGFRVQRDRGAVLDLIDDRGRKKMLNKCLVKPAPQPALMGAGERSCHGNNLAGPGLSLQAPVSENSIKSSRSAFPVSTPELYILDPTSPLGNKRTSSDTLEADKVKIGTNTQMPEPLMTLENPETAPTCSPQQLSPSSAQEWASPPTPDQEAPSLAPSLDADSDDPPAVNDGHSTPPLAPDTRSGPTTRVQLKLLKGETVIPPDYTEVNSDQEDWL